MEFNQIKELINMINDSKLVSFELKIRDFEIKMDKSAKEKVETATAQTAVTEQPRVVHKVAQEASAFREVASETAPVVEKAAAADNANCAIITSPMVGTFYNAASPEAEPFAKVGQKVKKGQVVCIVEAMKLMNEIESEFDGEVVEVLVENESMVEYGQPMFKVKKA